MTRFALISLIALCLLLAKSFWLDVVCVIAFMFFLGEHVGDYVLKLKQKIFFREYRQILLGPLSLLLFIPHVYVACIAEINFSAKIACISLILGILGSLIEKSFWWFSSVNFVGAITDFNSNIGSKGG